MREESSRFVTHERVLGEILTSMVKELQERLESVADSLRECEHFSSLARLKEHLAELDQMVQWSQSQGEDIALLTRFPPDAAEHDDINKIIKRSLGLLVTYSRENEVEISFEPGENLRLFPLRKQGLAHVFAMTLIRSLASVLREPTDRRILIKTLPSPGGFTIEIWDAGSGGLPDGIPWYEDPHIKEILSAHNGSITYTHLENVYRIKMTAASSHDTIKPTPRAAALTGPPCSPTLLIVDDSPTVTFFLEEIFLDRGFQVDTASDGYEGLTKIRQGGQDLIILDLNMPGIGGTLLISTVRVEFRDVLKKILVFSDEVEKHAAFLKESGVTFMKKTSDPEAILKAVGLKLADLGFDSF